MKKFDDYEITIEQLIDVISAFDESDIRSATNWDDCESADSGPETFFLGIKDGKAYYYEIGTMFANVIVSQAYDSAKEMLIDEMRNHNYDDFAEYLTFYGIDSASI